MFLRIYALLTSILFHALFPAVFLLLRWRPEYRSHFRERIGFLPFRRAVCRGGGPLIWLHAVSLGEVKAAGTVIPPLKAALPKADFVVSTVTPHGRRLAEETFKDTATVVYAPMDAAPCVKRALGRLRPDVLAFLETEIWPLWLAEASHREVKTAIINGRISPRSIGGYLRLKPLFRKVLRSVDRFSMITQEDAERIQAMGADGSRVSVNGNAKYDLSGRGTDDEAARNFRRLLSIEEGTPVIVAGSTRGGEEQILLDAFRTIRATFADAILIIAPRHLERVPQIAQLTKHVGFSVQLRTTIIPDANPRSAPVVILDTFGELFTVYGLATVVFCGASLVPLGGQNPLEPAVWGKVVLYGPSMEDFKDARALLEACGAGQTILNGSELAEKILSYLTEPAETARRGARGRRAVLDNQGAAGRHARVILELAGRSEEISRNHSRRTS